MADIAVLIDQILGGAYEGHETEIIGAIRRRADAGAIRLAWRLDWEGVSVTQEDLTVGEAKHIEKLLRKSIYEAAPARSAENIAAYVVASRVSRLGETGEEAQAVADKASIKSLLAAVSDYTIVDPPKESGDQTSP